MNDPTDDEMRQFEDIMREAQLRDPTIAEVVCTAIAFAVIAGLMLFGCLGGRSTLGRTPTHTITVTGTAPDDAGEETP